MGLQKDFKMSGNDGAVEADSEDAIPQIAGNILNRDLRNDQDRQYFWMMYSKALLVALYTNDVRTAA